MLLRKTVVSPAGFTLIELMIVIGLVAILSGILMPSFQRARSEGNLRACTENLRALGAAVHMYQVDNAGLLPLEASLANGGSTSFWITQTQAQLRRYVTRTPRCPLEGTRAYSYLYAVYKSAAGKPYWALYCYTTPSLHQDLGCPSYYPRWSGGYPGLQNGLNLRP